MKHKSTIVASELCGNFDTDRIEQDIEDLIVKIDTAITEASQVGYSMVEYNMPKVSDLRKTNACDTRLYIITEIISVYKSAGFNVKIKRNDQTYTLVLRWVNGLSTEDRRRRDQLLASHQLS